MDPNKNSLCGLTNNVSGVDNGIDRISALPDSVLCHILSRLPTKDAIATSILSATWKNLFPCILDHIDIRIDDDSLLSTTATDNQVSRVKPLLTAFCNKVFDFHLRDVKHINSFRLSLSDAVSGIGFAHITKWISSALHLNIKKLELILDYYHVQYGIPNSIFTCKTLEVLILVGGWRLKDMPFIDLPRLRVLRLANEPLVYNQQIPSSILCGGGFPVLEQLVLNSLMVNDLVLDISMPKLKRLEISECNNSYDRSFGIVLDAPALEYLRLRDRVAADYTVKNLDVIHDVYANLRSQTPENSSINNVGKFFQGCSSCVKLLTLSATTVKILEKRRIVLPVFHDLIHLDIGIVGASFLVELLSKTPKLEILVFSRGIEGDLEASPLGNVIPKCISSSLREIRISENNKRISAVDVLKFFLEAGASLRKIIIGTQASPACVKQQLEALALSAWCSKMPDRIFCSMFSKL
ncbi:hypothetical protein OROHE_003401 [Orobanche hederae]